MLGLLAQTSPTALSASSLSEAGSHDQHRVIRLADAAASLIALRLAGFGTVLRQGPIVHPQVADALAARSTGDEQRASARP